MNNTADPIYHKALHRFALATAISTGILIIAGALVTSTQSGLSVPDWPNTYGHFMFTFPLTKMVGGILYEHGHRMIASVVGFMILVLAFWLWKKEERRWVRMLGFLSLAAVITQGILGGLTVLYYLPAPISVSHATLAQTVFALISAIALFTSRWWLHEQPRLQNAESSRSLFTLGALAIAAIYVQLLLGAIMRHTESGLIVPDFPLAYGQLIPSLSADALEKYTLQLRAMQLRKVVDGMVGADQIIVHLLHRIWGFVVGGIVLWFAVRLQKQKRVSGRLAMLGWILEFGILMQIALGITTILTQKNIEIATAHVSSGALLLIATVIALLHVARLSSVALAPQSFSLSVKEVPA